MAKYSPDGALLWVTQAGADGYDRSFGIATDGDDNGVVTGGVQYAATFGAGEPNEITFVLDGWDVDVFVAKYAPDSTLLWAIQAGVAEGILYPELPRNSVWQPPPTSARTIASFGRMPSWSRGERAPLGRPSSHCSKSLVPP